MFRHLYSAYEPGRRANLLLLREQLKGGWKPTSPIRLYMPKPSGLLRPLTLLTLDDQIVLQAIANLVAKQVFDRRRAVEGRVVFSNCLTSRDSIFFLQDWRLTYHLFTARLQRHLDSGHQWIAHFDLAAFYETISHRALQSIVAPVGGGVDVWQLIRDWLCVWTSSQGGIPVDHGIPQGPIASDFLAEVFLLPRRGDETNRHPIHPLCRRYPRPRENRGRGAPGGDHARTGVPAAQPDPAKLEIQRVTCIDLDRSAGRVAQHSRTDWPRCLRTGDGRSDGDGHPARRNQGSPSPRERQEPAPLRPVPVRAL